MENYESNIEKPIHSESKNVKLEDDIPTELIDIVSKVLLFVENIDERRNKKE